MSAGIRVLAGARQGEVLSIRGDVVIGRGADADLRFDADHDLEVSSRHASIAWDGRAWVVRDLGSRNGTFVNGERITESVLRTGDRITFGWNGPEAEFLADTGGTGEVAATRTIANVGASPDAVVRENRMLRWTAIALIVALIAVTATAVWYSRSRRSGWQAERNALLGRIDSALAAGETTTRELAGEREGLAEALRRSQQEVLRVRRELEQTGNDDGGGAAVQDLRRQLQTAMAALDRQQMAASLDFAAIERAGRRAVAMIWVEQENGEIATGTAFAVRADATLITSRHVLTGEDTQAVPRRIAIQFSDSDQVWPARVIAISPNADVGVVRIDNIVGGVPVVPGLNVRGDTIRAGIPVALIGYPLGGAEWPGESRRPGHARPLGTVGVITALTGDRIELQGYGAAGASGSPVFDATGHVVGVLFGGRRANPTQTLVAVPAAVVARLLDSAN